MICIYKINVSGGCYVGQTTNFKNRSKDHIGSLRTGKHHNYKLQEEYNKDPGSYKITILEELDSYEFLNEKEAYWIKVCGTLNIGSPVGFHELPEEIESLVLKSAEYYITNKSSTIPEVAELYNIPKKTLYNIKIQASYFYLYIKYPELIQFHTEPTRYNKNKSSELIDSYQKAINELSTFRWESSFLKNKYGLGSDLASILYRNRFEEVVVPDILYLGIERMNKYYDCSNDKNILLIKEAIKIRKNEGLGFQKITDRIGGPSRTTLQDMVEYRTPKWEWLRTIRPDVWEVAAV